jgi:site-specific recombinase XerD
MSAPHLSCHGKGPKQRITPLTRRTVAVLQAWMTEHAAEPTDPLFVTRSGHPLSRDAIEHRVALHAHTAERSCPTLASKKITAHTLRHYVNGWAMWPARVFPLTAAPRDPFPAT